MKQVETFKRIIQISLACICFGYQVMVYQYYWYQYLSYQILLDFWNRGHLLVILIYGVLLVAFSRMYGGTKIGYYRNSEIIFSQIFASAMVNVITYFQDSLMMLHLANPVYFLSMMGLDAIGIIIWSFFAAMIYRSIYSARRMLLIHGDRPVEDIMHKFDTRQDKFQIEESISYREDLADIFLKIDGFDAAIIWDIPGAVRNQILKYCYGKSKRVYIMPKITDVLLRGAEQMNLFDSPILYIREYSMSIEQRFFKRMIDLLCALILLVLSSPVMLITAIVIKLYDGGPVLYKQVRCTENEKEFKILKFRSMRVDAEKDGVARLASKGDDRITPIGKFIRKVRIDELPQLINIIRGEMSFIGPRPERPEIIRQYMEMMPEFRFRMKVKAGLAGYAQVYGKYNTTPYDKLKLDLYYIQNYSVWLDIKLMFLTLKILLTPDSTEGVEANQITAMRQENQQLKERKARLDEAQKKQDKQ